MPGRIVLTWDGQGRLNVEAPVDQKLVCIEMLAEALKALAAHGEAGLLMPAAPRANLRGK